MNAKGGGVALGSGSRERAGEARAGPAAALAGDGRQAFRARAPGCPHVQQGREAPHGVPAMERRGPERRTHNARFWSCRRAARREDRPAVLRLRRALPGTAFPAERRGSRRYRGPDAPRAQPALSLARKPQGSPDIAPKTEKNARACSIMPPVTASEHGSGGACQQTQAAPIVAWMRARRSSCVATIPRSVPAAPDGWDGATRVPRRFIDRICKPRPKAAPSPTEKGRE